MSISTELKIATKQANAAKVIGVVGSSKGDLRQQFLAALAFAWRMIHADPDEDRWIGKKELLASPESWDELLNRKSPIPQNPEVIIQEMLQHQAIEVGRGYPSEEIIQGLAFLPSLKGVVIHWDAPSIEELFPNISQAVFLQITDAPICRIGPGIAQAPALQNVQLYKNQIEEISEELGSLTDLEELDLYHNRLKAIPESIGHCRRLRQLDISNNLIREIPNSLFSISSLEVLHLSNNSLEGGLSKNITALVNLEALGIEATHTTDLRPIASLLNLRRLYLDGNPIQHFPSIPHLGLRTLYISSDQLPGIVKWLQESETLAELGIKGGSHPVDIGLLTPFRRLATLSISDVTIQGIEKIRALSRLETLTLINNDLIEIPKEIAQFAHLKDLKITHQPLTSLPNVFGDFQNMISIDLSHNQLQSLPDSLLLNWRIRLLWAQGNPFSPERLADMQRKGRRI